MEFKKYSSLENSYRQKFIDQCERALPQGLETPCQVTEKIHGTNFSFYIDDTQVKTAKRTDFCESDFFACGEIVKRYEGDMMELFCHLFKLYREGGEGEVTQVIVYGELAGKGIQGAPSYGEKDFYVFDIKVNGAYLGTTFVKNLCDANNLKHAPVMAHNITLGLALQVNEEFKSKVFDCEGENSAEGIVIKPCEPAFLSNGNRIAIKKKAASFYEVSGTKVKVAKEVIPLCKIDGDLVGDIAQYLTPNRLKNVLSKEGNPDTKDFAKVAGKLLQDAIEDWEKDRGLTLKGVVQEKKRVSQAMMKQSCSVIKDIGWMNVVDGVY